MTKQEILSTARTIQQQLHGGGRPVVMSWGVSNWFAHFITINKMECPYLQFKVRGLQFKGIVRIVHLPVPDTYTVQLIKPRHGKNHELLIKEETNVYCDELTARVDKLVEKGDLTDEQYNDEITKRGLHLF